MAEPAPSAASRWASGSIGCGSSTPSSTAPRRYCRDGMGRTVLTIGEVLPPEDGRAVDEHDLPVGLVGGGGFEVDLAVGPEERPCAGGRVGRTAPEQGRHLRQHLLVHGPEQVLLVAEVMVEGAPGQPGLLDDLLGAGGLEPVPGEDPAGRVEQGAAGVAHVRVAEAPAGGHRGGHGRSRWRLIHDVSNIHNVCHRRTYVPVPAGCAVGSAPPDKGVRDRGQDDVDRRRGGHHRPHRRVGGRRAAGAMDGQPGLARPGRAGDVALHQRRGVERDLRDHPGRLPRRSPPSPPGRAQRPERDDAARVPGSRGVERHRRSPPRGLRGLRRPRRHRGVLLSDEPRRRMVTHEHG